LIGRLKASEAAFKPFVSNFESFVEKHLMIRRAIDVYVSRHLNSRHIRIKYLVNDSQIISRLNNKNHVRKIRIGFYPGICAVVRYKFILKGYE
jgi:hypothetical protein